MKWLSIGSTAVLFLLTLSRLTCAQDLPDSEADRGMSAAQWDVTDVRFALEQLPEQPIDVELYATFKDSTDKVVTVPGFYDGQNEYVVLFTPPSPGTWTFVTESTLTALNGRSGKLSVTPAGEGRKGGVILDPKNRRNFTYENGEAYYPIAFESDWLFALDVENAADIPVTRKFVDKLAASGFNQVVLNVFAYDVNWKKDQRLDAAFEYGSPDVFPFGGNNVQPDHSTLNIEYFQRLDRVIDYLDKKGIAAHLMIYVWNKRVNWPDADSEADNRYFDYVVSRYQAYPNLIWDISKEALGYGHNDVNYITGRIDRLRKLDAHKRLVTVHDYGYCKRFSEKVDFISVQIWASELYSVMRKIYVDLPNKPILNIEHGGYERGPYVVFTGSYTSPEVCLERAYQCVFAGTYPTHYWQGAAWNVIVPDIDSLPPKDRPRLHYYKHMNTLVQSLDFVNLVAGDKKSSSGFCLHNEKDLFVYYVPKENINIGVRVPKEYRGREMTGTWFDPLAGTFSTPVKQVVTQWPSFDKPFEDRFAILVVRILDPANGDVSKSKGTPRAARIQFRKPPALLVRTNQAVPFLRARRASE